MNTTISIPIELRDKIKEFGNKGEKYSEIIQKLYDNVKERQLQTLLMDETNTITIEQAIEEAKQKWPK